MEKKEEQIIPHEGDYRILESSSWAWASFLGPALSAVNGSAWVRLEGDFTFLSTFSANCLVHFFLCHFDFSTPITCLYKNRFLARRN